MVHVMKLLHLDTKGCQMFVFLLFPFSAMVSTQDC